MKPLGWAAHMTSPTAAATSMNGVTVRRQKPLEFVTEADAVLIGSGVNTRELANDPELPSRIKLDPHHAPRPALDLPSRRARAELESQNRLECVAGPNVCSEAQSHSPLMAHRGCSVGTRS
jgi:hypothetical protein